MTRPGPEASLGERVAWARKRLPRGRRGQESVGKEVGVTRQAVSAWENDVYPPEGNNLKALARCLGVSAEWILAGREGGEEGIDAALAALRAKASAFDRIASIVREAGATESAEASAAAADAAGHSRPRPGEEAG